MKIFQNKRIIFLTPLLIWLLAQAFIFLSGLIYMSLAASLLLLVFTFRGLENDRRRSDWPFYFYFAALFLASSFLFVTFLPDIYLLQGIIAFVCYFLFRILRNSYYHFRYQAPERADRLDSLLTISSFFTVFFLASSLYSLPAFLGWNFWTLWPWFFLLVSPLFFQPFVLGRLNLRASWPFFLAAVLSLGELSLLTYLLPLSFNILGFFVVIFYYLISLMLRRALKGDYSGRGIRLPVIACLSMIILLLLTASWL